MPRVPQYDSQVSQKTPGIRVPIVADKPAAAFGVSEAAANARMGESIAMAGKVLSGLAEQRSKINAEKEALKLSVDFQTRLEDLLYSPEEENVLDETEKVITRPKGILNRVQGQAKNAGIEFDNAYAELRKEYEKLPASEYERQIFDRMEKEHYLSARNSVIRHQAQEERAEYKAVIAASLNKIKQSANQFVNANDLSIGIERAQAINESGLNHFGASTEEIDVSNAELAGEIAKMSISAMLDKDPIRAQAIFEAVKDELPGNYASDIEKSIEGKVFADNRVRVWNAMSGEYRRGNGTYDKEAMREEIMQMDGFNTDQKEKLYNYAEARANDSEEAFKKRVAANDRGFFNEAVKMKNEGVAIDEILKLAAKYGYDSADVNKKENAVRKLFDNTVTDQTAYLNLYKGIRSGQITENQLEDNKPLLSGKDYLQLKKELIKAVENPKSNVAFKSTWSRIEDMATRKYPNKLTRDEYLTELAIKFSDAGGGSPEQLWKLANDELEKVKTKWFFRGPEKWKVSAEKEKALSLLKGKLEEDLGREVVGKIMFGIKKSSGKEDADASDVAGFAAEFGGVDAIKPGTPAHKAIQELIENKKLVTPEAVKIVLKFHPEWQ